MRLITSISALPAVALCAGLLPVAAALPAQALEEVDESIVWVDVMFSASVEVPWEEGGSQSYEVDVQKYCTGFFASTDGEIVTAGHCVETDAQTRLTAIRLTIDELAAEGYEVTDWDARDLEWETSFAQPRAMVGQPSGVADGIFAGKDMVIAQIVDWQPFSDGDNALLRVADLQDTPGLQISSGTPTMGQEVTAIGFPGSVSDVSDVSRQAPSYKSGTVSSRQYTDRGVPNTEIDAAVSGGMSGGPTLDEHGAVVGVNSFGIGGETQPFNFVTDTDTLRTFLARNGVSLESAPASSTSTPEGPEGTDMGERTDAPVATTPPTQNAALAVPSSADSGSNLWIWLPVTAIASMAAGLALTRLMSRSSVKEG